MRRGFKSEAERISVELRQQTGHHSSDPTDLDRNAGHLGIAVRAADSLVSLTKLQELESIQPGAFSACTLTVSGKRIVVYNPLSVPARTRSDIAHELAHVVLGHPIGKVEEVGSLAFFTCDPDEEQEATWFGGCLLLPRQTLVAAVKRGFSPGQVAKHYGVSEPMAMYRLRATGVTRQLAVARDVRRL